MIKKILSFSLLLTIFSVEIFAAQRIELRLLEKEGKYSRYYKNMIKMEVKGLALWEGMAVEISNQNNSFDRELSSTFMGKHYLEKTIEFQLGYISTGKIIPKTDCKFKISISTDSEIRSFVKKIPLRTLNPAAWEIDNIKNYDYLMPAIRLKIDSETTIVNLKIRTLSECSEGKTILFDPKVWGKYSEDSPKRFIMINSDAISVDWFNKREYLVPNIKDFFSKSRGNIFKKALSPGTNTHDTSLILFRGKINSNPMFSESRMLKLVNYDEGLVPMFLNAGYESISFNSNYLLGSEVSQAGFRHFINLNVGGSPVNQDNPRIFLAWILDWIKRHPDHDVFIHTWFDTTHVWADSPHPGKTYRPDVELYPDVSDRSKVEIDRMAKSISYVDQTLGPFFANKFIVESDVVFFSDHGVNFDTLYNHRQTWGSCSKGIKRPANWHIDPVEVKIPFAAYLHNGLTFKPSNTVTTLSLLKSTLAVHNPLLNVDRHLDGCDFSKGCLKGDDLLLFGHGGRNALIINKKYLLYSPELCRDENRPNFTELRNKKVDLRDIKKFQEVLSKYKLIPTKKVVLTYLNMGTNCRVSVTTNGVLFNGRGIRSRKFIFDTDAQTWMSSMDFYVPFYGDWKHSSFNDIFIEAIPAGCAQYQTPYVQFNVKDKLRLNFNFMSRVENISGFVFEPSKPYSVIISSRIEEPVYHFDENTLSWKSREFISKNRFQTKLTEASKSVVIENSPEHKSDKKMSDGLRAVMKAWGYIQDD